jgi:putative NADH-flavin reductase
MRVAVFGASGRTGKLLVNQCLTAGHTVVSIVRDKSRLSVSEGLEVQVADVFDADALTLVLRGVEAVFTCLGANDLKPSTLQERSIAAILSAMKANGIKRLVVLGASGALHPSLKYEGFGRKIFFFLIRNTFLKNPMRDSGRQERLVEQSDTDYTVVHPPRLTDGPRTGQYRVEVDGLPKGGRFLSRADLAEFMLAVLEDPATYRTGPYVAY